MKLLVNNVEQIQPPDRHDTPIRLYGRSSASPEERIDVTVYGIFPYLYAPRDEVEENETYLLSLDAVDSIEYSGTPAAFNSDTELAQVYTQRPQQVPELKEHFSETYNADVPFVNRFLIDSDVRAYVEVPDPPEGETSIECDITDVEPCSGDETPTPDAVETPLHDAEPRVVTFDIEVDDRGDGFPELGQERILSIVAHDSYDDNYVGFVDLDGRAVEDAVGALPDELDELHFQESEKRMLIDFRSWFNEKDPDLLTGWNADDFDIPFVIERFNKIRGINPNTLSPDGWAGVTNRGEARIKGRTVYDLLTVYKKNSFTELRSYTLDNVAKQELGAEKLKFDGTFFELYENDTARFLDYNARDVRLAVEINREAGVIDFRDTLRREVGVTFEESYNANDFIEMMCRRKLRERDVAGPTASYQGSSDYEGAWVHEAYEGVADNVVGIDLSSLYPYTMAMLNASPETIAEDSFKGKVARADNGVAFRQDEQGVLAALVEEAIGLKEEYGAKRDAAETDEEFEKWAGKYASAKTITNSIYGVAGWERFFLYEERVAEAITLTGQAVIKRTEEYVEDSGFSVIYGDTDSVYIKMPDGWSRDRCLMEAEALCDELNNEVYEQFAVDHGLDREDNLWFIETEAYMRRFFQAGRKKRYAYLATWKDGRDLDVADFSVSGFASKRSDSSALTKETEERVLRAILNGEEDAVGTIIFEAAQEIQRKAPEWERIGIPGGMNNKIDPERAGEDGYYAFSDDGYPQDAHPRAVWNANKILNSNIGSGDKPMRVYLEPREFEAVGRTIDVIAFIDANELSEIEDRIAVDVSRMTEVLLTRPLGRICNAVGVNVHAAAKGQTQTGLGAFS